MEALGELVEDPLSFLGLPTEHQGLEEAPGRRARVQAEPGSLSSGPARIQPLLVVLPPPPPCSFSLVPRLSVTSHTLRGTQEEAQGLICWANLDFTPSCALMLCFCLLPGTLGNFPGCL